MTPKRTAARTPRAAGAPASSDPGPRDVLASVPEVVFCCDADGHLLWLSDAAELLADQPATNMIGRPYHELLGPTGLAHTRRAFALQWARGPEIVERDLTLVRGDGSPCLTRVRVRRMAGAGGAPWFVGVAHAVNTSEEVEQLRSYAAELAAAAGAARAAAELKSEFLAMMSHEFRTPLNGVIGMGHLLLQSDLGAEQRGLVEVIQQSSQALMQLINDTLDFSKLEAGRLEVVTLDFDLRVTVEQVAALLGPLAAEKGLSFEYQVRHEVPSLLKGDPGRIRQVLLNLATNAVKLGETGTLSLQVERLEESDKAVALRFGVTASAMGAPTEEQSRLFECLTRGDSAMARGLGGAGLGLAISRRLVGLMRGQVGVETRPESGTTFWFQIPLEKRAPVEKAPTAAAREAELRGLRVLVADNSHGVRQGLLQRLVAWGCAGTGAADGAEALSLVREAAGRGVPYRVVIVDAELPSLSAEDLARALRADPAHAATLLILITHVGRPGDAARASEQGYSAYLMKPVDATELREAMLEILKPQEPGAKPALVTRHSLADARRGRVRVLVVEDEPISQRVAESALTRMGYSVEVAGSAQEGLEALERASHDVVLLDVQLPDLDGDQMARKIRARERQGGTRTAIVAVTGNMDQADRERCLEAGMDDYLTKPLDLGQLCAVVERLTRAGNGATEPAATVAPRPAAAAPPPWAAEKPVAKPAPARAHSEGPAEPAQPPLDLERLDRSSMGIPALRESLLSTFLTEVAPRLERLRDAVAMGDARRVEFEAHALKGMCATIGATLSSDAFGEVERAGREERLGEAFKLLQVAEREVERAFRYAERFQQIVQKAA